MPNIALRRSGQADWTVVEASRYPTESYLQDLLINSPDLIPFEDFMDLQPDAVIPLKEFYVRGSGSSDIVFVDNTGAVTIVECKLATNPQAKREVVAQVMDYAAGIMAMGYEEFRARAANAIGGADLVSEMTARFSDATFDSLDFEDALKNNLASGDLHLLIAIDQMNPDLRRLLDFVETRSAGGLRIFALEVQYHTAAGFEALIPQIANPPRALVGDATSPRRTNMTVDEMRSRLRTLADNKERDGALAVLDLFEAEAEWLARGRAALGMVISVNGRGRSLCTLEDGGVLWINAGNIRNAAGDAPVDKFLAKIEPLSGFEAVKDGKSKAYVKLDSCSTLSDSSTLNLFKTAIDEFKKSVTPAADDA